jgi:hypothetical protein
MSWKSQEVGHDELLFCLFHLISFQDLDHPHHPGYGPGPGLLSKRLGIVLKGLPVTSYIASDGSGYMLFNFGLFALGWAQKLTQPSLQ